ncbi:hypothetical protein DL98DRAFT_589919 [Cadophora sp. DSE1049]|nr:hypothetical protein DL98DRAFT_589919 [Cadophora sp. DSE1049]
MLRVLRAVPVDRESPDLFRRLEAAKLITRGTEEKLRPELRQKGLGEEDTGAIDVEDTTNIGNNAALPNTPPRQIQTSENAPRNRTPLDDLHSFLTWIEAFPDLNSILPKTESRASGQILGAFAIVWVAFSEAWLTKTAKRPPQCPDPAPHIISELSNDSTSYRIQQPHFYGALDPPTTARPSTPSQGFCSYDDYESKISLSDDSPTKQKANQLGLVQEEEGAPYRSQTESVQVQAFNNLINSYMTTIQTGPWPNFIATSNQKRFVFGGLDAGASAYFCACIDGFQRGLPLQQSEFWELENSDDNFLTWDNFKLLIENASILEAKAASRVDKGPSLPYQNVD